MDPRRLRLPQDAALHLLSDPGQSALVERFVDSSPERTIYHRRPYVEFARSVNGSGDLAVVTMHGNAVFGLPLHPRSGGGWTTGYAGVLLPHDSRESVLRRSFDAFAAFLEANDGTRFHGIQSAQSPGYSDPARRALLELGFARIGLVTERLYTRVVALGDASDAPGPGTEAPAGEIIGELPAGYDGDLRNQIRQGARKGLMVEVHAPSGEAERAQIHTRLHPVHVRSWDRTGLDPHDEPYLVGLSKAVGDGGGTEVVVIAHAGDGEALAFVTCHVDGDRALYWSGGSIEAALPLRANPVCLHVATRVCAGLGVRRFEVGRFTPAERSQKELAVTRYKSQFGGEIVPLANFAAAEPRSARARDAALALASRVRKRVGA